MLRSRFALSFGLLAAVVANSRAARADEPAPAVPGAEPASDGAPTAPLSATPSSPQPSRGAALSPPVAAAPVGEQSGPTGRFEFGSYGRVHGASDMRGGSGRNADLVAHGSRIDEDDYAELELRREDTFAQDLSTRIVTTVALLPPFFHVSGKADQALALRNLYAQVNWGAFTVWAGSRMYRGDDIYLLNWWPLDNLNTLGGGVGYRFARPNGSDTIVQAHVGQTRLDDPFQYQVVPVLAPTGQVGAVSAIKLDRPRIVGSAKVTQLFRGLPGFNDKAGFKISLYAEVHQLSAGVAKDALSNGDKGLPEDSGFLAGSQLTYFTGQRDTYVTLFLRHARGLATYDPLSVPTTFALDRTTSGSTESLAAIAGNFETDHFGVMAAGYARAFRDADPGPTSREKYDEGIVIARPSVYFGDHLGLAVEGSYQARRTQQIDPTTGEGARSASLVRGAILPYISPAGKGSFKRPILYLTYMITARSEGARATYPADDMFAKRAVEHFAGIGAEWWFNSSSYP